MGTQVFTGDVILEYEKTRIFKTLVTPYMSGKEQRRSKWTRPKHRFSWRASARNEDQADYIYDFFNTMQGRGESFYWECDEESPTSQSGDEIIGTGDGSTVAFSFDRYPVKSGDCTITVGGVAQTEVNDYTVNYAMGAITFSSAPGSGDSIVATSYRFYYPVRFNEDEMTREQFAYKLYNFGIELVEVI